jgi:hypothetical protein
MQPWRGKENLQRRIEMRTGGEGAWEDEVRKESDRNGGGGGDLGFGTYPLFIAEVVIGALNGPLGHVKIFRPIDK